MSSPTDKLPVEIWSKIIGFATDLDDGFGRDFFAISNVAPPYSRASLDMKIALSTVSRAFRALSMPFLYEAVCLHSEKAIHDFSDVISYSANGSDYAYHIKMFCVCTRSQYELEVCPETVVSVSVSLSSILRKMRNLEILNLRLCLDVDVTHIPLHIKIWDHDGVSETHIQEIITATPVTIRHLYWNVTYPWSKEDSNLWVASFNKIISLRSLCFFAMENFTALHSLVSRHTELTHFRDEARRPPTQMLSMLTRQCPALTHYSIPLLNHTYFRLRFIPFATITSLHVDGAGLIKLCNSNLLRVYFPNLQMLTYPLQSNQQDNDIWTCGTMHLSIHTVQINFFMWMGCTDLLCELPWDTLMAHVRELKSEMLPALRSLIVRLPEVHSKNHAESEGIILDATAHLRHSGAAVQVIHRGSVSVAVH